MNRVTYFLLFSLLAVVPCKPAFAQNGGAVESDYFQQMPTMYQKGTTYTTPNLSFYGTTPPTTATITVVAWEWAFNGGSAPAGLNVQLCNTDPSVQTCLDISNIPQGTTTLWRGDGLTSGPKFVVKMKVPGTGAINPVLYPSNKDYVIVNYTD